MQENFKKIIFMASIAFNVVLVATYAFYKLPAMAEVRQPIVLPAPLFLQLDLTSDQREHFRAERERFHSLLQDLGPQIRTRQVELIDLLEAAPADQQKIESKQGEIQRLQGVVQEKFIDHFLQASAFLTAEQRSRFFKLLKERTQASAQTCPPWTGSFDQKQIQEGKNE